MYLIDNTKCKYKDWNAYFKLALDDENISYFNVSEKPTDIKIANVFHHPVQV